MQEEEFGLGAVVDRVAIQDVVVIDNAEHQISTRMVSPRLCNYSAAGCKRPGC